MNAEQKLFSFELIDTRRKNWQPDEQAFSCPLCSDEFTLFNRKHHCRGCGKIICDTCSTRRIPLKRLGYTDPVRICDTCAKDVALLKDEANISHAEAAKEWIYLCMTVDHSGILERKILKGIPNTVRPVVWCALTDAAALSEKNPGIYKYFQAQPNAQADVPIMLDIPRTFPDNPKFGSSGTEADSLHRILRAYANFNPSIGYCQGMSFIVAVLLMHMSEENAFWTFVQMLKRYGLAAFFTDGIEPECLANFSAIFRARCPRLDAHIKREGCNASIFALQWIRTLFALDFDLAVVFRLWDIFFVQQLSFVTDFIVSMFMVVEERILTLHAGTMLLYIKRLPGELSEHFDKLISLSVKSHQSTVYNLPSPFTEKKKN